MAGELGDLPGGWPEPFRSKVLEGRTVEDRCRAGSATADLAGLEADSATRRRTLNRLLFAGPTRRSSRRTARSSATSRSSTPPITCTASRPGIEHVDRDEQGRQPVRRARGDRRGRRQGHAHGDDHHERPAASRLRARSQRPGRRQGGREGRSVEARRRSPRRSRASSRCRSRRGSRSRPGRPLHPSRP